MIRFDIVHDGNRRLQRQEGLVVLIGLHDEQLVAADAGVAAPRSDTAAGESRGISPGGRERLCDHDRGGRFAVCPCNRHARSAGCNELSQGIGATHDPEA